MSKFYDEQLSPHKMFAKEVERIEGLPQQKRWREIKNLLFKVKPDLISIDRKFCEAIAEEREFGMGNDLGSSKSGSTRRLYSMPQYLYAALHLIDPDFTRMQDDIDESKKLNLDIARAFPEYRTSRKI